jgi:hypothetical protein
MGKLALLAAVVLLAACGGGGGKQTSASRVAVTAYLTRVNQTEKKLDVPLRQVTAAAAAFGHARYSPELTAQLAIAQNTLLGLYAQLVLIKPPATARKLQSLLLQLVQRQAALAGELRKLSVFNPAFGRVMQPLIEANTTASTKLHATKKAADVAAAVLDYKAAIDGAIPSVRRLQPPAMERPLYNAQLTRLEALSATLGQLAAAIRARDLTALAKARHAVSVASVSSDSRPNQIAERTAVLEYNARAASVKALSLAVQREHDRLQVGLP